MVEMGVLVLGRCKVTLLILVRLDVRYLICGMVSVRVRMIAFV